MRSRRHFILESALVAAAATIAPSLAAGTAVRAHRLAHGELGFETFARLMNREFRASLPGTRAITLELVAAEPIPVAHGEQFVLAFRGPPDCLLGQDTYWFEQPQIGKFQMFIVPTASSGTEAASYVAVFNRLAKHSGPPTGQGLRPT
jgi:Domain of unknown function (DUF6916)